MALTGDDVRIARAAARLTQEQLAERAGLSKRGIQQIEVGTRRPRRSTEEKLRRVFDEAGVIFTRNGGVRLAPRKGRGRADGGDDGRPKAAP